MIKTQRTKLTTLDPNIKSIIDDIAKSEDLPSKVVLDVINDLLSYTADLIKDGKPEDIKTMNQMYIPNFGKFVISDLKYDSYMKRKLIKESKNGTVI